jgi:hypothetical protein
MNPTAVSIIGTYMADDTLKQVRKVSREFRNNIMINKVVSKVILDMGKLSEFASNMKTFVRLLHSVRPVIERFEVYCQDLEVDDPQITNDIEVFFTILQRKQARNPALSVCIHLIATCHGNVFLQIGHILKRVGLKCELHLNVPVDILYASVLDAAFSTGPMMRIVSCNISFNAHKLLESQVVRETQRDLYIGVTSHYAHDMSRLTKCKNIHLSLMPYFLFTFAIMGLQNVTHLIMDVFARDLDLLEAIMTSSPRFGKITAYIAITTYYGDVARLLKLVNEFRRPLEVHFDLNDCFPVYLQYIIGKIRPDVNVFLHINFLHDWYIGKLFEYVMVKYYGKTITLKKDLYFDTPDTLSVSELLARIEEMGDTRMQLEPIVKLIQ